MSSMKSIAMLGLAAIVLVSASQRPAAAGEGVKLLYSFEPDEKKVNAKGKIVSDDASHGKQSLLIDTNRSGGGRSKGPKGRQASPDPTLAPAWRVRRRVGMGSGEWLARLNGGSAHVVGGVNWG